MVKEWPGAWPYNDLKENRKQRSCLIEWSKYSAYIFW
jgi:hypothetical protein